MCMLREVVWERVSCINDDGSGGDDDDDIFRTRLLNSGSRTLYIQVGSSHSPPQTRSLMFLKGNLVSATYDVSLIHRGPPMLLAAVIRSMLTGNIQRQHGKRPIAIVYYLV